MKVLTVASLSSLAFIGVACSEPPASGSGQAETMDIQTPDTLEQAEAIEQSEDSEFTLNLFEDEDQDNGFNIGFEGSSDDPLTGFDFGDEATEGLLNDLPEIQAPITPSEDEELVELPQLPALSEDDIIRIPE
ncbi:MAG: hypothetical protein AAGG45_01510 [Pseudomonadota bacterium]